MPSPNTRAFTCPGGTEYTLAFPFCPYGLNHAPWGFQQELPVKYLDIKAQGKKGAPISLLAKLPGQKCRALMRKTIPSSAFKPKYRYWGFLQIDFYITGCSLSLCTAFPVQDAFLKAQGTPELQCFCRWWPAGNSNSHLWVSEGFNRILTEGCYKLKSQLHQVEKQIWISALMTLSREISLALLC